MPVRASSRVNPLLQRPSQVCVVGAGSPAKRPAQAPKMSLPGDNPAVLRDIRHDPAG
ncbi:hypothetical protein PRJ_1063 [Pseudomonas sp. XWY-1]|nr:hypothetical protein PRJ_1063 [Pseudomonas sp. XWY-1]